MAEAHSHEDTPEHWDEFWKKTAVKYPHETTISVVTGLGVTSVLEVGAGSGRDLEELARKGVRVTFADFSSEAARGFSARHPDLPAVRLDGAHLPFKDGSFDLIMSLGVLEHSHSHERRDMIREQLRVASRYVLVDVPQKSSPGALITKTLSQVGIWEHGDEFPLTYGEIVREVKGTGVPVRVAASYGREFVPLPRNLKGRFYSMVPWSARRAYIGFQQRAYRGIAGSLGVVFEKLPA